VTDWFSRRTSCWTALPADDALRAAKTGRRVSLVVPALNEEPTVGAVVGATLADPLVRDLLDEVVVIDGGSSDGTAAAAAAAGARVLHARDIAPDRPAGGKGGSVWRALLATSGDIVVVVDADLEPFEPRWVAALVAPLLLDDAVHLVKGAADRPLTVDGIEHPRSGGRVTELMARPLLNALWPELGQFVQPLSGELAGRRALLESLPFATGYGLEIGMLIDALGAVGLDGLAQVDLGERRHRHQSDLALGRMASAVLRTALARAGRDALPATLVQFVRDAGGRLAPVSSDVPVEELPPVASLR
jgi:glucosyl-3-phosphoglycerate synthase